MDSIINNWIDFRNNNVWLVTNRHNIYPPPEEDIELCPLSKNYEELLPYYFDIYLKNKNSLIWEKIRLQKEDLLKKGRVHDDADVDIAVIEITEILKDRLQQRKHYIDYLAFNKDQFPTVVEAENTEIIVVGFPQSRNGLATKPEIRSGTIRSKWGSKLDGFPIFEADLIAESGFSGSPVISRLRDSESTWETIAELEDNQPSFLGVCSGLRKQNHTTTSIVFYGNLVEEAVKDGLPFFSENCRLAKIK